MESARKVEVKQAAEAESLSGQRSERSPVGRAGGSDILFFLVFAPLLGFLVVNLLTAAADYAVNGDPGVRITRTAVPSREMFVHLTSGGLSGNIVSFSSSPFFPEDSYELLPLPTERSGLPTTFASADFAPAVIAAGYAGNRLRQFSQSEQQFPEVPQQQFQKQELQQQQQQQQQEEQQQEQKQQQQVARLSIAETTSALLAEETGTGQDQADQAYIRFGDAFLTGELTIAANLGRSRFFGAFIGDSLETLSGGDLGFDLAEDAVLAAVTGATLTGLLKADDLGLPSLALVSGADPDGQRLAASIEAAVSWAAGLGHLRSIDIVELTSESGSPSRSRLGTLIGETGTLSGLLKRRLLLRTPVEGRKEIIPLRVGTAALLVSDSDAGDAAAADDRTLSPAYRLQPAMTAGYACAARPIRRWTDSPSGRSMAMPLGIGYVVFLVAAAIAALLAHRRKRILNVVRHAPSWAVLALTLPLPIAYGALTWMSWTMPVNWLPDGDPLLASAGAQPLMYALVILAGAASGGMLYRAGFQPATESTGPEAEKSLRASLVREVPVDDLRRDRLGFANLVLALATLLDNRDTVPPIVIAVTGPWGSGKSSIMRMLENELAPTERFHFAWFNAWQYRDEKQILDGFLRTIARGLSTRFGPTFMLRIGWIRLRGATYMQLLKYSSPLFLIAGAAMLAQYGGGLAVGSSWLELVAGAGQWVLTALGIGGAVELARWLKPFQQPLGQLLAPSASQSDVSHVEQFNEEFRVFREAVGDKKFLIFIDDLDRCPPEAVVEVLKAINLIATADAGPGRTFFVLGMDWHYVLNAIEIHFEKLIGRGGSQGQFGREYLKKIVTLPLSVPRPSRHHIGSFVRTLDAGSRTDGGAAKVGHERLSRFVSSLDRFAERPFNVVASVVVVAGLALGASILVREPQHPAPEATTESETAVTADGTPPEPEPEVDDRAVDTVTLTLPAAEEPSGALGDWWPQVLVGLLGMAAMVAAAGRMARLRRESDAPPEPSDPPAFVDAVKELTNHMPDNPRDLIRLVNLMRMAHLIQDPSQNATQPSSTEPADPFSGAKFTPAESARFSLLYYQMADVLDIRRIEEDLIPALEQGSRLEGLVAASKKRGEVATATWANDLIARLKNQPETRKLVDEPAKLRRFVEIYRNLLSVTGRTADKS